MGKRQINEMQKHQGDRQLMDAKDQGDGLKLLIQQTQKTFFERFNLAPRWTVAAPGRVNLIGDHTDYTGGYALPMAIDRYTVVCAAAAPQTSKITLVSKPLDAAQEIDLDAAIEPVGNWSDYARGVFSGYQKSGVDIAGLDIVCGSNLPRGAGLSSSASFEVALATLVEEIYKLAADPAQKMRICQTAEHDFAGVPCGVLDQFSVCMAQPNHLMLLDCRDVEAQQIYFDNDNVSCLIVQSGVNHALGDGAYATRRQQCEAAELAIGNSLRDANIDQIKDIAEPLIVKRARHVVSENARVLAMSECLPTRDWAKAGELMYQSHASMRDDFEASCDEVDQLVQTAQRIGISGGVFGARMTGGGFGGAVVMLVKKDNIEEVLEKMRTDYRSSTGREAESLLVTPTAGAHLVTCHE